MIIFRYRNPRAYEFLSTSGFLSMSENVGPLPDLSLLLSTTITSSSDDQQYILIPILMEVLAAFYVHQDAVFELNEFISERFPVSDEHSYESLLG